MRGDEELQGSKGWKGEKGKQGWKGEKGGKGVEGCGRVWKLVQGRRRGGRGRRVG